jgi:hypothetical protein
MILSRRQFLKFSAGSVVAISATEVFNLSALAQPQPMSTQKDRPQVEFIFDPDGGLRLRWGPSAGPWGIFTEGAKPQTVDIDKWWLYVGEMVNPLKPDHGSKAISKDYNGRDMGTSTEITIPKALLPQKKTVVVQVLGRFDSKDVKGKPFKEGIYSDEVQVEMQQPGGTQ